MSYQFQVVKSVCLHQTAWDGLNEDKFVDASLDSSNLKVMASFHLKPIALASIVFTFSLWWFVNQEEPLFQFWNRHEVSVVEVEVGVRRLDGRLFPEKHNQRDPTTIELDWVVRQEQRFPDGVEKTVYTVNGMSCVHSIVPKMTQTCPGLFPGPTIEARPGDRILLNVYNELEAETTAIHFHGIRHLGSNSMDGTPGLTQVRTA